MSLPENCGSTANTVAEACMISVADTLGSGELEDSRKSLYEAACYFLETQQFKYKNGRPLKSDSGGSAVLDGCGQTCVGAGFRC